MILSNAEFTLANEYCKGYTDKEVADNLHKSINTTKTQKKSIYRKLGISKDTELLLYMLCDKMKVNFDLKEIRKHGLELLFCMLFLMIQITNHEIDMRRGRMTRGRTTARVGAKRAKRASDIDFNDIELC